MLQCEWCGKIDETVGKTFDPFDLEINGIEVPITVCRECYQTRASDI